jgi:hypothetical protein
VARKKPGDGIGYTAAEWNRHEDAADYVAQRSLGSGGGEAARLLRTEIIRIKNSSGAARRKGEILEVGNLLIADSLILKEGREQLRFDTAIHDGTDAPFCVLLDPIPDGGRGRAQIAGVCPALVNFTHADQRYARPANNNDVLQAGALGQVRVLYKPSGTGEKECLVNLSDGRFQAWGVADQDIAAGNTDTVSIHSDSGDTGMDEEVKALGLDLTATKKVWIELTYNKLYGFPLEC